MNIDVNSWHFRIYRYFFDISAGRFKCGDKRLSLCRYFWALVFIFFMTAVVITAITIALGSMVISIWNSTGWWTAIIVPTMFGVATAIPFVANFAIERHYDKQRRPYAYTESEPQSLLGSYVKAKKQKVCPILNPVCTGDQDEDQY